MADKNTQVGMFTLGMVGTNCYFVFDETVTDENGKRQTIADGG